MIPVTKPFLPPIGEYRDLLQGVWERAWLTNMGPLANKLEINLKEHLGLDHLLFVTNGTIALQIAIRALKLNGEIITTPFSYVATTSSIVWENCKPVFVDIDEESLNIDPAKIEDAITDKTTAILATHVYGNPCNVAAIQTLANKHNLKVIYDGAHAFGVNFNGDSIFKYGDISTCSLHATKLFHSGEGGLIVTKDLNLSKDMSYIRNFGHSSPETFYNLGINGKNSELHAAMGLVNIRYIEDIHLKRKLLSDRYDENLKEFNARKPLWNGKASKNYAYYPMIFDSEDLLLNCIDHLESNQISGRRYFYPSLPSCLPYVQSQFLDKTERLSKKVFCLPLYFDLTIEEVDLICTILLVTQNT